MELTFNWKRAAKEKYGIHCAAEESQEWMLPWWWSRYCDHNDFPVTFFDFGMTKKMRRFCEERGEVICVDLDPSKVASVSQIDPSLATIWEGWYGKEIWHLRLSWIKKTLTFLYSRYEKGLWIDIDCEILGSVEPLFSQVDLTGSIALVPEHKTDCFPKFDPQSRYNSGVVLFQHGAHLIEAWAEAAVHLNHLFAGDDYVLSHLINTHQLKIVELPQIYNWRISQGLNLDAVIVHWLGKSKEYIRLYGGIKPAVDDFHRYSGLT